jgi:DNA invertase Pin-like site-specific DNA recombinase
MAGRRFIAYYRVSSQQQGRSGLGLAAQQQAVRDYLNGGRGRLVAEHTEIESGKRNDRPELAAALAACRVHVATLVVAKLDRLSRNAAFLLTLRDSGVDFIAADMPEANRLTVGVLAVVAEHEREAISARTRAALSAAKARGVRLGNPAHLNPSARRLGAIASARVRQARAAQRAADLASTIAELRRSGASTLRALAQGLNGRGIPAARGGQWNAAQVRRVLADLSPDMFEGKGGHQPSKKA